MTLKRWIILACALCNQYCLQAQDIQSFLSKINDYNASRPVEKVFIHLDKTNYTAGETIWLKAYVTLGVENLLSNLSKIAYVDLISPNNQVVAAIKIPLISGLSFGDIALQDTLVEGTYRLRGYTNWMRNDSAAYFYNQNIHVSNGRVDNILTSSELQSENYTIQLEEIDQGPLESTYVQYEITEPEGKILKKGRKKTDGQGKIDIPFNEKYAEASLTLSFKNAAELHIKKVFGLPASADPQNSIQFFPEGGTLLAGALNKIAAKALRPSGMGIKATSYVLNSSGDTVARLATNELGMGSAAIFIQAEETYHTSTDFQDGTSVQAPLPPIVSSGYNLQINNSNANKLFAQVNLSPDRQDGSNIYFMVHYRGQTFHTSLQKASQAQLGFSISKKELPSGILTLTILNGQFEPIMERPVFIHSGAGELPLEVELNAPSFGKREKVSLSIQTGTPQDSVRNAVLSASVIKSPKDTAERGSGAGIQSVLYLSSELRGYIENPSFYFSDQQPKTTDIDNLLLTQGWRKIDLLQVDSIAAPKFPVEKSISIRGRANKLGRKAGVPSAKMTLIPTTSYMDFIDTIANQEGEFSFDNLLFADSVKFILTAKDQNDKNRIDINHFEQILPQTTFNKDKPGALNNINSRYIQELKAGKRYFAALEAQGMMERSIALEEVVVNANARTNKAAQNTSNFNGRGNADQVLGADDLSNCSTLEQCLNGRLMGVYFQNGEPYNTRSNAPMQLVLDGMYVDADQIQMIDPSQVQSIEVLRNANYTTIYGQYGSNGLIIITSKTGADAMQRFTPKGIITIQPKGLHINKTFYKPEYGTLEKNTLDQDLRNTLHWEPNIITDEHGMATFYFYTSDETGNYKIDIQGLDFSGRLVSKTLRFQVE
ncbi:MAG: TonB-dependent receptor plug domain-containing protein [Sphingobacterium sp.]